MNMQDLATKAGIILVEIDGSGIKPSRTYTDKASGQQRPLPGTQTAFIWQGSKYPVEVAIDYEDSSGPYRPGFYFLGGPIFAAGDYGRTNFRGFRELVLAEVSVVLDSIAVADPKSKAA